MRGVMRWIKQIITTFCALQLLLAPDVCLMLCCHQPATTANVAHDEADLPPCHRHQQREKQADAENKAFTAACDHLHEEKPLAEPQQANSQSQARHWLASNHVQLARATVSQPAKPLVAQAVTAHSPPLRERNLPLRI